MPSFDYEIAKRLARNLIQTNDLIYSGKIGGAQEVRDNYMAENAVWLMNVFGNTNKICLWAHNAHISSDGTYFRSMGFTLRDSIGAVYQRIGFGFSRGSFNAIYNGELKPWTISNTPVEESTNFLLANLSAKNFILRLSDIRKSEAVYPWLNQSKKFLQVSAVYGGDPKRSYWGVTIGDFYDVLIYFDETTSSSIF